MKNQEIRELSDKELSAQIKDEKHALIKIKMQHAVSPLENTNKMKSSKRLIARLLTEKRKRELTKAQ